MEQSEKPVATTYHFAWRYCEPHLTAALVCREALVIAQQQIHEEYDDASFLHGSETSADGGFTLI